MSLEDEYQEGRDQYLGSRLKEHDEKIEELHRRLEELGKASEPVEIPAVLANFVASKRSEEGITNAMIVNAIFKEFGLGAFSDRKIIAALEISSDGDKESVAGPGE